MAGDYLFYNQEKCSSIFESFSVVEEKEQLEGDTLVELKTTSTTTTSSTISNEPIIQDMNVPSVGAAAAVKSVLESHA